MLVARQQAVAPDRVVGEILFDIGKAGDGSALGDAFAAARLRIGQDGTAVAQRGGHFAGFEEGRERPVQVGGGFEGEHRRLAAGHHDGVEGRHVDVSDFFRLVDQGFQLRGVDEALADEVGLAVAAGVVGVAHAVGHTGAAGGAEHLDLVSGFVERQVGVGQLAPPEAHRPAGGGGNRGVGDDEGDALGGLRVQHVGVSEAHGGLRKG